FRDYTRKKHEEQALIKAKENAEAAAKAKSDFLSVMSHELRTPLHAILGMSYILQNTEITQEQIQCVETITNSSHELLDKIKNILDFNHLESGDIELQNIPYSLTSLIIDTLNFYSSMAKEKQIALTTDISTDINNIVMDKSEEIFFTGDPKRIQQILGHLVSNAIKFSNGGSVHISVNEIKLPEEQIESCKLLKFKDQAENRKVLQFKVSDQGIGLSEKEIGSLFKPFFQADSSWSRKFEGTGLGLAISKRLIELMGGEIRVESERGKGSRFIFTIVQSSHSAVQFRPNSSIQLEPFLSDFSKKPVKPSSITERFSKNGLEKSSGNALNKSSENALNKPSKRALNKPSGHALNKPSGHALNKPSENALDKPSENALDKPSVHTQLKILVAEDNKVNQMLIKKILTRLGYSPVIVENGLKAVEACGKEPFDLVLMDIQMPEMDGLQASRKIQENSRVGNIRAYPKAPAIIALTANITEGIREECLAAGMSDYMSKPLKIEKLTEILTQLNNL
ncbi:MAG: response regulator, partial [Desulfamplus sp.]|nr:response regulator [Desulfamplus sp.]